LITLTLLFAMPGAVAGAASPGGQTARLRAGESFEQRWAELLGGMNIYFGNLHSHTAYSGGQGTPAQALTWARDTAGYDFYAITDHGEFIDNAAWADIGAQTDAFNQDGSFVAMRGFEWSNIFFGHCCVYNTATFTSMIATPLMKCFYEWLVANNGYAQFNHPGREPGLFSGLKYSSDEFGARMLNIETGNKDVGNDNGEYYKYYPQALDKGWMVAPTNNQDNHELATNGHRTAIISPALTRGAILDSMVARREYSTDDPDMKIIFKYGDAWMGSSVERDTGAAKFDVMVEDNEEISKLELITTGGAVAAETSFPEGSGSTKVSWEPSVDITGNSYYFVRATERDTENDDEVQTGTEVAVTAPIWINLTLPETEVPAGTWLKGDLHSHSTYSDGDSDVASVISIAESKGLDYYGLTDHNTTAQWSDPAFHSDKLTLLNGVEWTTEKGHANIWSDKPFDWSRIEPTIAAGDARTAIETAHQLAAEGKQKILFSLNHPYGFACVWQSSFDDSKEADCMEVWNSRFAWPNLNFLTAFTTLPSYLKQGKHITMVGGSDSHAHISGDITKPISFFESAYNDIGNPTTWVYAKSKSATDILEGILEGHASISLQPSGPQLRLAADATLRADEPKTYEVMEGDSIPDRALGRRVRFRASVAAAFDSAPSLLIVWKNDQPVFAKFGQTTDYSFDFVDVPRRGDFYRVQLNQLNAGDSANPLTQLIQLTQFGWVVALSNPIYTWSDGPTVASITPSSGLNNGIVAITDLAGTGFRKGAVVELRKAGQPSIVAGDVSVASSEHLTCKLDLTGAAPGKWDVVVNNPNDVTATLTGGFTVAEPFKSVKPVKLPPKLRRGSPVNPKARARKKSRSSG
jgi:predicted metal-dependent phosphoesterase TrpH